MKLHFATRDWDSQLLRALSFAYYGGSDVSECLTIASRIHENHLDSWHTAWFEAAETLFAEGMAAKEQSHLAGAQERFLRATCYAKLAMAFLYPTPSSAQFSEAYERHCAAFEEATALFTTPTTSIEIPYQNRLLKGTLYRGSPQGHLAPTVIVTGGCTSTQQEDFFTFGAAALRRGYNVFCFDGPGQGEMLYKQGCPMTYAWEEVICAILDRVSVRSDVDPESIVLIGLGWGSLLSSRAAALEPRVRALVTYPGHYDALLGLENSIPNLREMLKQEERTQIHQALEKILSNKTLGNKFLTRMWIHGVESVYALLEQWVHYNVRELGPMIACPTLVCDGEGECLNEGQAKLFFESLQCPKEYLFFSGINGSGEHCETGVSAAEHEKIFHWLAQAVSHS